MLLLPKRSLNSRPPGLLAKALLLLAITQNAAVITASTTTTSTNFESNYEEIASAASGYVQTYYDPQAERGARINAAATPTTYANFNNNARTATPATANGFVPTSMTAAGRHYAAAANTRDETANNEPASDYALQTSKNDYEINEENYDSEGNDYPKYKFDVTAATLGGRGFGAELFGHANPYRHFFGPPTYQPQIEQYFRNYESVHFPSLRQQQEQAHANIYGEGALMQQINQPNNANYAKRQQDQQASPQKQHQHMTYGGKNYGGDSSGSHSNIHEQYSENNNDNKATQTHYYYTPSNDLEDEHDPTEDQRSRLQHLQHKLNQQQQQFEQLQQHLMQRDQHANLQQQQEQHQNVQYNPLGYQLPPITTNVQHTPTSAAAAAGIPLAKHTEVTKHIPVHHYHQVHVPYNHSVPIQIPHPVITTIPRPFPIHVPISKTVAVPQLKEVKIPIEKVKPFPVERPVPFIVERRVPYRVEKQVATPVYYPYPIKVPILKTVLHRMPAHSHSHFHSPHVTHTTLHGANGFYGSGHLGHFNHLG